MPSKGGNAPRKPLGPPRNPQEGSDNTDERASDSAGQGPGMRTPLKFQVRLTPLAWTPL